MPVKKKSVAKKNTTRKSKNKYLAKKMRKSMKKGKKQSKKIPGKKRKKKSKAVKKTKPVLINGGGCGCGNSLNSNSFKSYMSDLKGSLLETEGQTGAGYSVDPSSVIANHKPEIVAYNDLSPPVIIENKLVEKNCRQ